MESNVWRDRKIKTSIQEIDRQYRLIKQTLAMHHSLCCSYRRRSTIAEILLLTASVIFLVTTFADTKFYLTLGLPVDLSKIILGLASAVAFLCSLILLLLDWPEKAVRHKDSAEKWFMVSVQFRNARLDNGTWPEGAVSLLNDSYVNVCNSTESIPDKLFNSLKKEYLVKMEVSKLTSKYPGAPLFLLKFLVLYSSTFRAILGK